MIFQFLKYLQPTHYFSLLNHKGEGLFPIANALPPSIKDQLELRSYYQSAQAKDYDLSWQALQKGYIGDAPCYTHIEPIPLRVEYAFIRTYFNAVWVWYVLLLRLLSLYNPIKELQAFMSTRSIQRSPYLNTPITHPEWKDFKSPLLVEQPKVSVIIPTLNRYAYLKDVLSDLEVQNYPNFEVIVVDQSEPYQPDFYSSCNLDLHVIYQEEESS